MKKKIWWIVAGVAVIVLIIILKNISGSTATKVSTESAKKRTIIETVSANGKIQPEVEVKISSDVSGEIVELYVKEGDAVKKGDLLCKINPLIYESNLNRMEATLNGSRASLQNSRARLEQIKANFQNVEAVYKRNKKLFEQGAISQSEMDVSTASYEGAKADIKAAEESVNASDFNVKSTEASLKEASDNLAKTNIYSPVNGTVSQLNKEKGERVVGTAQMEGTEIMRLANLNEMEVSVDVNENDIVRVHNGDTSLIEVDAYLDKKFKGIVTEIANSANTTGVTAEQVTNFTVKIRILQESYKELTNLSNSSAPFRPGMSASVDIQTKKIQHTVSIPIQSVTTRSDSSDVPQKDIKETKGDDMVVNNDKDKKDAKEEENKLEECVFILVNGKAKKVKVKTGIQDNTYIQIISGIKEGDEVIAGPYAAISKQLKDGMIVKKVDKSELFTLPKK
ncbi:MAG TPA: efflux RND transporter periplasmic adaptor subunit [Bacteroidia bacterium]|jgi:HlyD family secretion protein|nr:efflux RND transporter periplasmic adaptor subunit [Bacteroidia bacterium]